VLDHLDSQDQSIMNDHVDPLLQILLAPFMPKCVDCGLELAACERDRCGLCQLAIDLHHEETECPRQP
jgi:hypothetical protein